MAGKLLGFISGIIGTAIEHMSSLRLTLKAGRPQYWRSLGWTLAARLCILISMVQLQKHAATKFSENLAARTIHGWQALMIWLGCRRLDLLHLSQRAVLLRLGRKVLGLLMVLLLSLTGVASGQTRGDSQAWFNTLWLLAIVVAAAIGMAALWVLTRTIDAKDSPQMNVPSMPSVLRVVYPLLLVAFSFPALAFAHNNPNEEQGLKPYDSWHGGDLDSVSLTNGGLSLQISLASFPQRGSIPLDFFVRYSSKQWRVYTHCIGTIKPQCTAKWVPITGGGAQLVSSVDWIMQTSFALEPQDPNIPGQQLYDWSRAVAAPDGNVHQFGNQSPAPYGPRYPLRSLDATGLLHPNAQTVVLRDGTVYSYPSLTDSTNMVTQTGVQGGVQPSTITDANGNQITRNSSGWTDTLGRTIPGSPINNGYLSGIQPGVPTSDLSTCPAGTSSALIWNVPGLAGVNSGIRAFKFCYAMFTLSTAFGQSGVIDYPPTSTSLLSSVVLPDLTMWTFDYDNYGDIVRLGFPTGGSLSYTYAFGPSNCNTGTTNSMWATSRTVGANDGTGGHTWNYRYSGQLTSVSLGNGQSTASYAGTSVVSGPDGNDVLHTITSPVFRAPCSPYETQTQFYQGSSGSGTLLKTVATQFSGIRYTSDGSSDLATNVVPVQVTTTLGEKTSKSVSAYDATITENSGDQAMVGSLLQSDEYDFSSTLARSTLNHYLWQDSATYQNNNFVSLLASTTIKDGGGTQAAQTTYTYDQGTVAVSGVTLQLVAPPAGGNIRGNQTTASHWLNTNNSFISSSATYFDTGMKATSTDANGNATSSSYSSSFAGAYVTQTNMPDTGSPVVHHVISGNYDFNTGLLTSFTDQNSQQFTYQYDNMLRLTQGNHPDGGQTTFNFPNPTTVERQKKITATLTDDLLVYFDGVGRGTRTKHVTSGNALVDTTYDALGRTATVTNPYFTTSELSYGVTQNQYDSLSRVRQTTKQDGGISTISYSDNCTTTTEEAGKQRRACTDAMGRLTSVWEDPGGLNYETDYQYDALGNMLRVDQKGSAPTDSTQWRTRLFTYDSLSRLLTAYNPESGLISYFYDNNGNLLQKVMPSPNQLVATNTHTISYCYDVLNRVNGKAYSWQNCQNGKLPQGTAVVSYNYDENTNGIGHLTSLSDQAGSAIYNYDILGRMSNESRTINGVTKAMSYTYNLDGSMATMTYPSGAILTYTPNAAGQMLSVVDSTDSNHPISYVTGAAYNAPGLLTASTYGQSSSFTGILSIVSYNSRLQPVNLWSSSPTRTLMNLIYDFHVGNGDNGNVYAITNNRDASRSQTFTYDPLNRLLSAQNAGTDCTAILPDGHTEYWGNNYVYDAWGNLNQKQVTKCSAENLNTAVNPLNRLQSYDYDAAGNMTKDNNGTNYVYDPENRISSTSGFSYVYDADGNRVQKTNANTNPATGTLYWYMSAGTVGESDLAGNLQSEYVFFDGERVARKDFPGNAVSYYFSDHLKTASVISDATGSNIKSESDYYPWGGELQFANGDSNHYKYTGKERDSETGLDYFGARYYSNGLGRFTTPDWSATPVPVPYADLTDPQSLNQYSYVRNIPTSTADVTGHCIWDGCVAEVTLGVLFIVSTLSTPTGQQALKAVAHGVDKATDWAAEQGNKVLKAFGEACGRGNCTSEFQRMRPDQMNQSSDSSSGQQGNTPNATPPKNTLGGGQMGAPDGPKKGSSGGPTGNRRPTPAEKNARCKKTMEIVYSVGRRQMR